MTLKKIINFTILFFLLVYFTGCGESGNCITCTDSSSSSSSSSSSASSSSYSFDSNFTLVSVERGPVFFATVKDANDTNATNSNFGSSNVYRFSSTPTLPISVVGGYIDIDRNNVIDTNDIKLDINMSSYSYIVSPITTLIENNNSIIDELKNYYSSISENDLLQKIPSDVSKDTVLLSNAIYKSIKNGYTLGDSDFNATIDDINTLYNTSYSSQSNLKTLHTSIETEIAINELNVSKLTSSDITQLNALIKSQYGVEITELNSSSFSREVTSSDSFSDIWNVTVDIPLDQSVSSFDIGINILKDNGAIGNILIRGLSLSENNTSNASSVDVYGKKSSGSEGSKNYDSNQDITQNAVSLINGNMLLINLGYIIENQNVVSSSSFKSVANYEMDLYFTNVNTSNSTISSNYALQYHAFGYTYTFDTSAQKIDGNVNIK